MNAEPWAKIPETVATMNLDATSYNVLILMSSKAGRDRVAWLSQGTIAERLQVHRTTVGKAMRRLERKDLIRPAGTVVVDHEKGTWVRRYEVAPYLSDLHVANPGRSSVSEEGNPDERLDGPDERLDGPDENPGRSQSSSSKSSSSRNSYSRNAQEKQEHVEGNPWCTCDQFSHTDEQEPTAIDEERTATPTRVTAEEEVET